MGRLYLVDMQGIVWGEPEPVLHNSTSFVQSDIICTCTPE